MLESYNNNYLIIVLVYNTREHYKNKQDNTLCRDLFVFISVTTDTETIVVENIIPSLRSKSRDIAQYPEIANQSNCAILGGSRVVYTK